MRLTKFTVTNYKVFRNTFTIEFSDNSIAILTGRNNTGKSTILEAINCFFQKASKANAISNDCFSDLNKEIILESEFDLKGEKLTVIKKYEVEATPKFYDKSGDEIKAKHKLKDKLDKILERKPFYITPSMLPDDINDLIQSIYSEILKGNLESLENSEDESVDPELVEEYEKLKKTYPEFLKKIKLSTDRVLEKVSNDVSINLQTLFSNKDLVLSVEGGESEGFSPSDILKSTSSEVYIDSNKKEKMSLANQGTGLQRMSLIFLIQNMIEKKLLGEDDNKLLLIDEPEAFLHPEAVRALSRSLYKIGEKMPLIISTHSPILIDLSENHTSIQVFRVGEKQAIRLYKSEREKFDEDDIRNMKILNYVDSYVNEFFFADKIVIVEGDTEYIAFKHFAKVKNVNVHIIRARGKSTIVTLMKILNQFNTSYDVLHDVDNNNEHPSSTLKAQLTNCKNIFKQRVNNNIRIFCSISNFENAIGIGDIANHKKTQTIYELLHTNSDNEDLKDARRMVENLFDTIVNRDKTENTMQFGFREIHTEQDYEDLFVGLIEQKIQEEFEAKKKEKTEKEITLQGK